MTSDELEVVRSASAHVLVDDLELIALPDDAAHHVFRVLRVRDGELVTATDGRGGWRTCRANGGAVVADGGVRRDSPREAPTTIACAIPKRERPEWIVQKLTELGVARIVFLHADRSVVRWDAGRARKHLEKLRRVAAEALQQSRGVWLPAVDGPVEAAGFLPEAIVAEPGGRPIAAADDAIAIGPEGGWTERELAVARGRVSLGATVLRVETAAVAAAVGLMLR